MAAPAAGAEAPPTLLDALARAPAAAALVVRGLEEADDRKALRLAHPQLRDAVGEATTRLDASNEAAAKGPAAAGPARPPTARRWPRLRALSASRFDRAALAALALDSWPDLRALTLDDYAETFPGALDRGAARGVAAALRCMPALERLELLSVALAPSELFPAAVVAEAPRLRSLCMGPAMTPAAVRALAASGLRLAELDLSCNSLRGAGVAALLAAPTFAPRQLTLNKCSLDAAALAALARAPWPLEELNLAGNDFDGAEAAPALAALSRRAGIRKLDLGGCRLSAAGFKALVEADWPALTDLNASSSGMAFAGPRALGAAAFAGFPALEELNLSSVNLGVTGARALASGHWPCLRALKLVLTCLGAAAVAELACGSWPALEELDLGVNGLGARLDGPLTLTLDRARSWAPMLKELRQ